MKSRKLLLLAGLFLASPLSATPTFRLPPGFNDDPHLKPQERTETSQEDSSASESEPAYTGPTETPVQRRLRELFKRAEANLSAEILPLPGDWSNRGEQMSISSFEQGTPFFGLGSLGTQLYFIRAVDRTPAASLPEQQLANACFVAECVNDAANMSPEDVCFLGRNMAAALAGEPIEVAIPPGVGFSWGARKPAAKSIDEVARAARQWIAAQQEMRAALSDLERTSAEDIKALFDEHLARVSAASVEADVLARLDEADRSAQERDRSRTERLLRVASAYEARASAALQVENALAAARGGMRLKPVD